MPVSRKRRAINKYKREGYQDQKYMKLLYCSFLNLNISIRSDQSKSHNNQKRGRKSFRDFTWGGF